MLIYILQFVLCEQNHSILGLEETLSDHLIQHLCLPYNMKARGRAKASSRSGGKLVSELKPDETQYLGVERLCRCYCIVLCCFHFYLVDLPLIPLKLLSFSMFTYTTILVL